MEDIGELKDQGQSKSTDCAGPLQLQLQSQSVYALSQTAVLKKSSPLKHVTPIIKKYDYQRQAKNGKSVKLKVQGNNLEENPIVLPTTPIQSLAAGMDSLDAALRRAEKCIAGSKDQDIQPDDVMDTGMETAGDEIPDVEEEGIPSSSTVSNQQNTGSNRSTHPRARNRVLKKRNQLQKDLEHALPLATPDQALINEERSFVYATSFFSKVKERFETQNSDLFAKFLDILDGFGKSYHSLSDMYHRMIHLFDGNPDLCEEFLLFLKPQQALLCGKFMEHLAHSEMLFFNLKLELYFAKQPQQLRKILAAMARIAETPDVKLETVRSTLLPLLRGNAFLADSFLELLPSGKPPENKMTDFDQVVCEDIDGEHSGEEEPFERIEVPPENDYPYGGDNCQCCCHSAPDLAFVNRTKHCIPCGIKFISGKVFMQTEHGLRPARVEFSGNGSITSNIKRLNVDQKLSRPRSRRGRNSTSLASGKIDECKQNVETDDEAVFLSKNKSPRQRPKIPKINREKPSSARSLPLNQDACLRKAAVGNLGSPPLTVIQEQEAPSTPAASPSGDQKPPSLVFSNLLNVLQRDHDSEKDNILLKTSPKSEEQRTENPVVNPPGEEDEIKEECRMEDGVESITESRNSCSTKSNIGTGQQFEENDVKSEEEMSTDEMDLRAKDCGEDNAASSIDASVASSDCDTEETNESNEGSTWTRDEDRIILCNFQSEPDKEKTFRKISTQLPHRTIEEISSRFQLLMNLIQQMR